MVNMQDKTAGKGARRLVEVTVVILLLFVAMSILMPSLNRARSLARKAVMKSGEQTWEMDPANINHQDKPVDRIAAKALRPKAEIKSYTANIDLTPTLSIGTSQRESIYEAKFHAKLSARNPSAEKSDCEVHLPLPPQLISLSDLEVKVNGEPSEDVFISEGNLVWHGTLTDASPVPLEVTYSAVGKGIYTLHTPPGKIVDTFEATLTAHSSDLRLMELSLQPQEPLRDQDKTVYKWKYERLMIGRPIAIDILGIAPMDRLGELVWLGPLSVLVFGLIAAIVTLAFCPEVLDKWMLLLIVGTFAAAYPLMYFTQEFSSLNTAVITACAAMLVVIAIRSVTLMGIRVGLAGPVFAAAAVFVLTMLATVHPRMQGMLITIGAVATLVAMMVLVPKAQKSIATMMPSRPAVPTPKPTGTQRQEAQKEDA